jgi:hypothetical protein
MHSKSQVRPKKNGLNLTAGQGTPVEEATINPQALSDDLYRPASSEEELGQKSWSPTSLHKKSGFSFCIHS